MKIKIHNPSNLQTVPYTALEDLQGDFKTLSPDAASKLKASIMRHGIFVPKFVWRSGKKLYCIDGHQTKKVLASIEEDGNEVPEIPVVFIQAKNRQDAVEKLLVINSRYGKINRETSLLMDFDFELKELESTIHIPELNLEWAIGIPETEDDDAIPENVEPVTSEGDLWELNDHRLICGDSTNKETVGKLCGEKKINLCLTDPPYSVDYKSRKENPDQTLNSYIDPEDAEKLLSGFLSILPSTSLIMTYTDKQLHSYVKAVESVKFETIDLLIWKKQNFCFWPGARYQQMHELIFVARKKGTKFYSKTSANASTIIEIDRQTRNDLHPTIKPIALWELLLLNHSKKQDIIYDPFLGSGTTIIACEKIGRIGYGIEMSPHFCDISVYRYAEWCKNNNRDCSIQKNGGIFDLPVKDK